MTMPDVLETQSYLTSIAANAALLTAAVERVGFDAAIPTCPGWVMRDLVLHLGEVHRWATIVVRDGLSKPSAVPADHLGELPPDGGLLAWFDDGQRRLVETLAAAPADLTAFTFLADPRAPKLFWARRQTHETGMHRVDAESATGSITPFSADLAADGIDEMLTGFVPRPHTPLRAEPPVTMSITLADHPGVWRLRIGDGPTITTRDEGSADCRVVGSASDVFLALWNRQGIEPLTVSGAPAVLAMFLDNVHIGWR
jgi:uncharacterized protein (TIGR03083 family)